MQADCCYRVMQAISIYRSGFQTLKPKFQTYVEIFDVVISRLKFSQVMHFGSEWFSDHLGKIGRRHEDALSLHVLEVEKKLSLQTRLHIIYVTYNCTAEP